MQLVFWILIALAAPSSGLREDDAIASAPTANRETPWIMGTLTAVILVSGLVSATSAALRSRDLPQRWGLYEVFMTDTSGIPFIWTSGRASVSLEVEEHLLRGLLGR